MQQFIYAITSTTPLKYALTSISEVQLGKDEYTYTPMFSFLLHHINIPPSQSNTQMFIPLMNFTGHE